VHVGRLSELGQGGARVAALAPDEHGKPREVVVVRDEQGVPRAYRNLCRHLPVPLDAGSRTFLKNNQLECATHGARYRLHDGLCVAGPCRGTSLYALELEFEADEMFVIDAP
jgi:nitrite reductase/ring-hydroxylating ferredoxin subunit